MASSAETEKERVCSHMYVFVSVSVRVCLTVPTMATQALS